MLFASFFASYWSVWLSVDPMGKRYITQKARSKLQCSERYYQTAALLCGGVQVMSALFGASTLYPSATSSAIMTVNPAAKNNVPRLECSPAGASGISSSTTT